MSMVSILLLIAAVGADAPAPNTSVPPINAEIPQFVLSGPSGDVAVAVAGAVAEKSPVNDKESVYVYPAVPIAGGGKLEVKVFLEEAEKGILRKRAAVRLTDLSEPRVLKEVTLATINCAGRNVYLFPGEVQSYPAFVDNFFVGIEFPIAATRRDGDNLLLAYRPGIKIEPDTWYETRKAICGTAPSRDELLPAFRRYILEHRPKPNGLHVNYNSWWTSPAPYYKEQDILDLMGQFDKDLYQAQKTNLDTFCIDMGWSNPKSLWEIDPKLFPDGFTRIQAAAEKMQCELGLWISPSSLYPTALDNGWAKENGYEAAGNFLCLGGKKYAAAFRDRLVELVTKYKIRHIKLDGYVAQCSAADHGHEPGACSADAIASGIIEAAEAVHKAAPDVWLEPTGFGFNPSPWWLFHFNSVIGCFGDDAPFGRVPAPVYRESYTTARDYFNLQGDCWNATPAAGEEVLGIIHQTREPFLNDAVMTILRGHMFLPLYVNPAYMNGPRWQALADVLKWARQNAPALEQTTPLPPKSWLGGKCPQFTGEPPMPREPYGYSHASNGQALVALRNPWIMPQDYALTIDKRLEFQPDAAGISAVSLYPEPRLYGGDLKYGDVIQVPLAPYETVVLRIAAGQQTAGLPACEATLQGHFAYSDRQLDIKKLQFDEAKEADILGPDSTSLIGAATKGARLALQEKVIVNAPLADLLILVEGREAAPESYFHLGINGAEVKPARSSSEDGWGATGQKRPEQWFFFSAPLATGENSVALEMIAIDPGAKVSVWAWAARPGKAKEADSGAFPEPERVSLDSLTLLEPTVLMDVAAATVHASRPVERINGVFLDSLDPVSATQGWGTLQKNQSVWGKPLIIAGKRYRRGLGTHAPSKITYNLDGKYQRFQAWAGADNATTPTVTFEVWVDGQKKWESGIMKQTDPAKPVDIDVTGAKILELIVGDGGNGIGADHADWADAKLLK